MAADLDADVTALARRIAELGAGERAGVFNMSWWSERMLTWAMANPSFKTQLFRFVDVFPATAGDADILRHVHEYFEGADAPRLLDFGVEVADHVPAGEHLTAAVARRNIARMARQFIVGASPEEAAAGLARLWRQGSAFTVDLLGEKTIIAAEADRYVARVGHLLDHLMAATASWPPDDHLEFDDAGRLPRVNISVKPTACAVHYAPLSAAEGVAEAAERLGPVLRRAAASGAFVWLDMEQYDAKDLTFELFRTLLDDPDLVDLHAGLVVQAYLRDSHRDLQELLEWGAPRAVPISVRLVKGAYWDAETIAAGAEGWVPPTFLDKAQTDANFERCVRLLHDHHGAVRAAFGSHNLRSLAYAITEGRRRGIPDTGYEIQMLHGMAEPVHAAIRRLGLRLRVYCPVGDLLPGMSYLVRRLLENTSNESFVRRRFADHQGLASLLAPPAAGPLPGPAELMSRPPTPPDEPGPYRHEPLAEWRRPPVRASFAQAVDEAARRRRAIDVPAVIGGERAIVGATIDSVDPGRPDVVVARSASCGAGEAQAAVDAAKRAAPTWRALGAAGRAAVLFGAAEWLRRRRESIAALEVFEAGKPWAEADADVCEAIDFCEYYGREARRLDHGGTVESPPGERNRLRYEPKGVGVVIAPWNFPLAIPTGMVTAALVTGNPVVLKPAEQTPAVAYQLVLALEAAGLPPGVLAFLPGRGEDVGDALVRHVDVAFVVFTGSKAVGLGINAVAAHTAEGQRSVKRVVAEMGGKNAVILDADADLDQALPAVVYSAFGYAGQKCSAASRVIVLDERHDEVVERLVGATREVHVGQARVPGTLVGPVIDAEAQHRIRAAIAGAGRSGRVLIARDDVPTGGYFVGPTLVDDVAPTAPLARDELFGPVLCVQRAATFEEALEVANATEYALTAGVFSRSPAHIALAADRLRAGNVYVNRGTTGAVVGRQPFGGYGLSGVGSKAGGPDYLLQFVDPRVVTENTLRQGFAPLD